MLNEEELNLYHQCLVLNRNSEGFLYHYIQDSNMATMYKNKPGKLYHYLQRVFLKFNFPFASYFLGEWKKDIKKYQYVIIFDNGYSELLSKYIRSKNKNCIINVFFWNCVNEHTKNILTDKNVDYIFSFDPEDVKKYNLLYNSSFFSYDVKLPIEKLVYDITFIGLDKGREQKVNQIITGLEEKNIKIFKKIVRGEQDFVDYDTYISLINKSKAILDITQEGQSGLTARAMESLFLKKKLVTDNVGIKDYDFYNPKNIFIIGVDDFKNVADFIAAPYEDIPKEIVEKYDYKNWCLRFIKKDIENLKKYH